MSQKTENGALDDTFCVYGARVLLKHLQSLSDEIQGVHAGNEDIEFIHRARVASRRLRAALPLFQDCFPAKKTRRWLKEIRRVTRALGEARDTDVQLERVRIFSSCITEARYKWGINRLILRLGQKRQKIQKPVIKAMDHLMKSGDLEEMRAAAQALIGRAVEETAYTPILYQRSAQAIQARLETFLAFDAIVTQPEKVEELHEMRIAAKQLRYTIESFAPLYSSRLKAYLNAVKESQELLGEIHDCDVWIESLPRFLEEERQRAIEYTGSARSISRLVSGIRLFEQDRQQARNEQYLLFQEKWLAWKDNDFWRKLSQTVQTPVIRENTVYPPPARL